MNPSQTPSMKGQIAVVTGGTSGIGFHTAMGLAQAGAHVIITGRNEARGQEAVARLKAEAPHDKIELALGDLGKQLGIDALAEDLAARFDRLDILINNAGYLASERQINEDGFEMNFAINVVAPYKLTHALLPLLKASEEARVINLTGGAPMGGLDLDNLQAEKGFAGMSSYTHAKRAAEAMSMGLSRELEPHQISVNIVYPGAARTQMTNSVTPSAFPWYARLFWPLFKLMMQGDDGDKSARKAAQSSIFAASSPELKGVTGKYYDTKSKLTTLHADVLNTTHQDRVLAVVRGNA